MNSPEMKNEYDYHKYWKDMYEKEHKLRLEAQGETTIVKGIGMNSPEMKDAQARIKELDNSLAIALEINEEHQRYNGKLQTRVTELEEDNKKLAHQVEDIKLNMVRKSCDLGQIRNELRIHLRNLAYRISENTNTNPTDLTMQSG